MPYTTAVAGNPITAALWNANTRDQVVTPFASAAARSAAITAPIEGMLAWLADENVLEVYDGARWVTITPKTAEVATQESTGSASYTNLATAGPAVSVRTGTTALVVVSGILSNSTALAGALMTPAVSGATTLAASVIEAFCGAAFSYEGGGVFGSRSATFIATTLTPGLNTFTLQYRRDTGGTATFRFRCLSVVGIPGG